MAGVAALVRRDGRTAPLLTTVIQCRNASLSGADCLSDGKDSVAIEGRGGSSESGVISFTSEAGGMVVVAAGNGTGSLPSSSPSNLPVHLGGCFILDPLNRSVISSADLSVADVPARGDSGAAAAPVRAPRSSAEVDWNHALLVGCAADAYAELLLSLRDSLVAEKDRGGGAASGAGALDEIVRTRATLYNFWPSRSTVRFILHMQLSLRHACSNMLWSLLLQAAPWLAPFFQPLYGRLITRSLFLSASGRFCKAHDGYFHSVTLPRKVSARQISMCDVPLHASNSYGP
jgi:hypothetical protein